MELNNSAKEFIDSTKELLAFLEANPKLANATSFLGNTYYVFMRGTKMEFAEMALKLGTADKSVNDTFFNVERAFGIHKLQVTQHREDICEKVVTGSLEVEIEVQDPELVAEALAAIPKVTKTITKETFEYVCPPSLHDLVKAEASA